MAYVVLSFFSTDIYDDPRKPNRTTSYFHVDPATRAEGPTYLIYLVYAQICVATHVIGIPAFFCVSLHRVRHRLDPADSEGYRPRLDRQRFAESLARCDAVAQTRVNDPELRSLRPLWFVYLPEYYNFEVLELLRRMVMMALPKLASRKPVTQTAFTCLMAYVSTRFYRQVQPFLSTSDSEFMENTQWLTLILSLIIFYIAANEQHGTFAGYAIILVFVTSVIHATILVSRDLHQEKVIAQTIQAYMSKVRNNHNNHHSGAMPDQPNFGGIIQGNTHNADDPTRSDDLKNSSGGDDYAVESDRTVAELRSPLKVGMPKMIRLTPH